MTCINDNDMQICGYACGGSFIFSCEISLHLQDIGYCLGLIHIAAFDLHPSRLISLQFAVFL